LEFTAEESTIGLPRKVQMSLGAVTEADEVNSFLTRVTVRYVRLKDGNFVQLQPRGSDFSRVTDSAWGGVKSLLETSLKGHTTLTVGDVLSIEYADKAYDLEVMKLKPDNAVSILNTDIEVDITTSRIAEEKHEAERLLKSQQEKAAADASRRLQDAEQNLPDEPPEDTSSSISCLVRMPDGRRCERRVMQTDLVSILFDAIHVQMGVDSKGDDTISYGYPRKSISRTQASTMKFEEIDLRDRQIAFFFTEHN